MKIKWSSRKPKLTMEHIYQQPQFGPPWFEFGDIYKEQVESAKDGAHFVEVGCFLGKSAAFMIVEIINSGKKIQFDMIDHWKGSIEHQDMDIIKNKDLYATFITNMAPFTEYRNTRSIRMKSVKAAQIYEDESLDFVFIDASHEEKDVKNDIDAWFPKVKKGGILAGDDWGFEGVNNAVQSKFSSDQYGIRGRSWIVQK
jgi:hypothetical protein